MNKKDRKANAILAHAHNIVRLKMAKMLPVSQPKKIVPKKSISLPDVHFSENEKFDTFKIVKMGKADYRVQVTRDWVKLIVPNRFKSIIKAQEWCDRHRKEK